MCSTSGGRAERKGAGRLPTPEEWDTAKALLRQQPALRDRLSEYLRSFPRTGLYADELGSNNDDPAKDFSNLMGHVRTTLGMSPRRALFRAANRELRSLYNTDPNAMDELLGLLGIALTLPETTCRTITSEGRESDIHALADALEKLTPGLLYVRWRNAEAEAERVSPWEADAVGMKERLLKGLRSKRVTQGKMVAIDDATLDAAVRRAKEKNLQWRLKAEETANRLKTELQSDEQYLRYIRVNKLWESTGARELWEALSAADKAEGRERRGRGGEFEGGLAVLVFCLAVLHLLAADDCVSKDKNQFWYVRGAHWVDGRGSPVGEIDLVVMHRDAVAAICELKLGCFEISPAFAQHEAKLAAAVVANLPRKGGGGDSSRSSKGGKTLRRAARRARGSPCAIATSDGVELPLRASSAPDVPIFVATSLTPINDRRILGLEPALSLAICDGIEAQGQVVADQAMVDAMEGQSCLSELLVSGCLSRQRQALPARTARKEGKVTPTAERENGGGEGSIKATPAPAQEHVVDLAELEQFVRERLGREQLSKSPAGCLARSRDFVFVIATVTSNSKFGATVEVNSN